MQVLRDEVISVERVQNPRLWTKYQTRRAEVVAAAGFAQERFLFHGSAPGVYCVAQPAALACLMV